MKYRFQFVCSVEYNYKHGSTIRIRKPVIQRFQNSRKVEKDSEDRLEI